MNTSPITTAQKKKIATLHRDGVPGATIAKQLNIGYNSVRTELSHLEGSAAIQTVQSVLRQPDVEEKVKKNVFDITKGLQDCLEEIQDLLTSNTDAPLKEQVSALNTKLAIYVQAANITEKIYNARAVEAVVKALITEYEQEQPDIQQRILQRIGTNPDAVRLLSTITNSGK